MGSTLPGAHALHRSEVPIDYSCPTALVLVRQWVLGTGTGMKSSVLAWMPQDSGDTLAWGILRHRC